jgi:iron(II)-dependent oxidoreductase
LAATSGATPQSIGSPDEQEGGKTVNLQFPIADLEPTTEPAAVVPAGSQTALHPGHGSPPARATVGSQTRWWAHLLGWRRPRKSSTEPRRDEGGMLRPPSGQGKGKLRGRNRNRPDDEIPTMTKRLIDENRYAFVLLKEAADQIGESHALPAWRTLQQQMALVPAGRVPVVLCDGSTACHDVSGYFLDRFAVSNQQFQRFVQSGGYEWLEIWPQEVWPSVSRFTDRSGRPGPRDWEDGKFPMGEANHPVVGVSWYEAAAYARWVGKRLPTAVEWQKAGGWPEQLSGGACNRYPWGDLFDPARTNLWPSDVGRTVPVSAFANGATPNGIFQMTGNVWEWLDDPLEMIPCQEGEMFFPWKPMRRIIGGAFNTYFPSEATCQFVTGQGELDRLNNIGFRCAVSLERLQSLP